MINEKRLLERFLRYVQIDSPTKDELKFAKVLMEELVELGLEVRMDDAGEKVGSNSGNVIGVLKGNNSGTPIIFSAHMDTVSPSIGVKPIVKDGAVYSDGTTILGADDKAGIAAIMEALSIIKEQNLDHGHIEVAFSIFEEGGLFGAKNLDYSAIKAKLGFVFDTGGDPGLITVQGPAQSKVDIKFIGKPAHAGVAPEEGISAIQIAAEAISNMKLLRIDEETTANIGSINGGGPTNIVTKEVILAAEARSLCDDKLKEQTDHMTQACENAAERFGGKAEVKVEKAYGAFKIDENAEIVEAVKVVCKELSIESKTVASGGGSDTNIFNVNGITAVNLAIGERLPHTLEEHIYIKDLENAARIALGLVKHFA